MGLENIYVDCRITHFLVVSRVTSRDSIFGIHNSCAILFFDKNVVSSPIVSV